MLVEKPLATPKRMKAAMDRGELVAHYQPFLDLKHGGHTRVEALARWSHPTAGVLPAGDFIPAVEEAGLIGRLGWQMIDTVLSDRLWACGPAGMRVSVNLPVSELRMHFADALLHRLNAAKVSPERLVIEVTEGEVIQQLQTVRDVIAYLRDAGVRIVLDDFGTGYSSLARLEALPITGFKLDRGFIHTLSESAPARATVKAIVDIAVAHGLTTCAEGVETQTELEIVTELGCDWAQGFHIARPMSAEDARRMVAGDPPVPALADAA